MAPRGQRRIYIAKKEKLYCEERKVILRRKKRFFICTSKRCKSNIMKLCVQCGEHFPDDKNFCANSGKMLVNSKYSACIHCFKIINIHVKKYYNCMWNWKD